MCKPTLNVLCGIQGSGKSTYAKNELKYSHYKVFSSDEYRKKHPDMDNNNIFSLLYKELKQSLIEGKDCVLDATNITIKSRRSLLDYIQDVSCSREITIFATPYHECISRVNKRNSEGASHFVPLDVVRKYMMSFEIPFYEEGWDKIYIFDYYSNYIDYDFLLDIMYNFNQNNEHHKYNLGEHCEKTLEASSDTLDMWEIYAYKLHDIGKMFTVSIGKDGQAHYYNHANVGAYCLLTCNIDGLERELEVFEKLEILFLINYHMKPFDWKSEKSIKKWKEIFGDRKFNKLVRFNKCDRIGSGTKKEEEK